jgi:hypothetical protein
MLIGSLFCGKQIDVEENNLRVCSMDTVLKSHEFLLKVMYTCMSVHGRLPFLLGKHQPIHVGVTGAGN